MHSLNIKFKTYHKNIISITLLPIALSGCYQESDDFEEFSNKLQNDFNISSQAITDLKNNCASDYVQCFVKHQDAIIKYESASINETWRDFMHKVAETKQVIWNISDSTITAEFQSSISTQNKFTITEYDTTKMESFAAGIDVNNRYDVSTTLETKEVKGNPNGLSNLTLTASTKFDNELLSHSKMNELFTSYKADDGYSRAFTMVYISRDIPVTFQSAEQNLSHKISVSFVQSVPLQITNETMSELLAKTWY